MERPTQAAWFGHDLCTCCDDYTVHNGSVLKHFWCVLEWPTVIARLAVPWCSTSWTSQSTSLSTWWTRFSLRLLLWAQFWTAQGLSGRFPRAHSLPQNSPPVHSSTVTRWAGLTRFEAAMGPHRPALLQLQVFPSLLLGVIAFSIKKVQNCGDHVPVWAQAPAKGHAVAPHARQKRPGVPTSGARRRAPCRPARGRSSWEQRSNSCSVHKHSLSCLIILSIDDVITVFLGNVCNTRLFHLLRRLYIYANHFTAFSPSLLLPQVGLLLF